jgi:polysaccharide biosynthesis transport protein
METPLIHPPNPNHNALPPQVQPRTLPWANQADDEWDLRQFLSVVQRRGWAIAGVATLVMGFVTYSTFSQKPIYEGQFRLLVEPVNADNNLSDLTSALGTLTNGTSLNPAKLDYETQVQVLRSPELMNRVVKTLENRLPDVSYEMLVQNLTIIRPGETKILEIRFRGNSPIEIQIILNALSKAYLEYSLVERQTNLRQGIQFIDKQLPVLQQGVDDLQDQLQRFRQQYDFIDPDSQASQITGKVNNIEQQRLEIDLELAKARSYFDTLQGQPGAVAALNEAPVYQSLISELRRVETQIAGELTRFKEGNINIRVLREKRANLLPLLRQEAQRVLGIKLADAATQIQIMEVRSQTLAAAQGRYSDLQRELQVAIEALNRFLSNRQTLQVQAAQTEIPWQVIEAPQLPQLPISPNIKRNLILGLVASGLLGIGAALLLEKLDNVFHTLDDLKAKAKLPVLGSLPMAKELAGDPSSFEQASNWVQKLFPRVSSPLASAGYYGYSGASGFLEALRVLHTNIQLLSSDRPIRSLIISSAMPGDGKSTVSIYLAQTAAAMGQKVLLVDADLRKPQVHNRLNLSNEAGLSNLISHDLKLNSLLHRPQTAPGLTVLTAGQIPPDPTKLFASQKMRDLMVNFQQSFDLVIYDAPPLIGLADASLLAPHTDGLILVARIGQTDRTALTQAIDNVRISQIPILGIVANGIKRSFGSYHYYQYQYGQSSQILPGSPLLGKKLDQ